MLDLADIEINGVIDTLSSHNISAAFLVPTATGLSKSIMDAHGGVRSYLKTCGLHDYSRQGQGGDYKKIIPAKFIYPDQMEDTRASLYRPTSGNGDPRIWFGDMGRYAAPGNVIALIAFEGVIYLVNASSPEIINSISNQGSPFWGLAQRFSREKSPEACELLDLLKRINGLGYVRSMREGPTGVGMTLETLLGISANSSKSPDYKGIEIKASRINSSGKQPVRSTLFSKVPKWKESEVKSAVELIRRYGYDCEGRRQLYCSISSRPNSLGLSIGTDGDWLHVYHGEKSLSKLVKWDMDGLRSDLKKKHKETFWVKALTRKAADGVEEFKYVSVMHTRGPLVANFDALVAGGYIELDFVMHLVDRAEGQRPRARDHGYLFKIHPKNLNLLFPPAENYDLSV